jgi:hypothetical protein
MLGSFACVFLAHDADLDAELLQDGPKSPLDPIEAPHVDDEKLATLTEIINGEDPAEVESGITIVRNARIRWHPEGPWLFELPDRLLDPLCSADAVALDRANAAWLQAHDWVSDGLKASESTRSVLDNLAELAKDARESRRRVYLWVSP